MWSAVTAASALLGALAGFGWWASAAVAAGASPWPYAAAFVLGYAALVLALTLLFFAVAWFWRSPRPHDARIGPAGTARLLWNEYAALLGAMPRMILYRVLVPDDPPAPSATPVLLVHGVLCNAGVWTSMRRRLAAAGIGPLYALSYGPPLVSIERFAGQLAAKIDAILAETGARDVALVTHSMGGLVARAYLRRYGTVKVRRAIMIGAPHRGSVHARLFPGVSLSQLRPGNAWLAALNAVRPPPEPPIVSIWSWHDSMVAPQLSSRLEGARDVELSGVGHNALLTDEDVARRVASELVDGRR